MTKNVLLKIRHFRRCTSQRSDDSGDGEERVQKRIWSDLVTSGTQEIELGRLFCIIDEIIPGKR